MVLGGGGISAKNISYIVFSPGGLGGWGLGGVMLKFSFMLSGPGGVMLKFSFGRRPDKIDLQSRNLNLRKMHFYKKPQKLIKKILLLKTLKNIVILHIINKL